MTLAFEQGNLDKVLLDLVLLFTLCIAVVIVFHRLRLPPIVGFLAAGALLGPNALGLIGQVELVRELAEIGVVVLLFTVGLELSLRDLLSLRRSLLLGGGLQVGLTIALGAAVAWIGGAPWGSAILLGMMLSLSSTAVVAKLLHDRGEVGVPHGRLAMSICVSQDLAVVVMILVLPLLGGGGGGGGAGGAGGAHRDFGVVLGSVLQSFALLIVTMIAAWFLVPRVLDVVARTRSREAFVLAIFALCLMAAMVTSALGLSLALGAFLIGLILAESRYRHQATSEVEPFRDAFSSLFFISIGMLFDYRVIVANPLTVSLALGAVVLGKAAVVMVAAHALGLPGWVGLRAGLLLAQVGEFSFVLVQVAGANKLELGGTRSVFLDVAVLSMALTPSLLALGRRLTRRSARTGPERERSTRSRWRDHVVIVGFGPGGQSVARALRSLDIPFVAVEMNSQTVKDFRAKGDSIFVGDSTREAVLTAAGVSQARMLVLAINDAGATRRTSDLARRLAPDLRIVARANYLGEVPMLQKLGVDEIVAQELETSVELVVRVLRQYLVPADQIDTQVGRLRETVGLPDPAQRSFRYGADGLADFLPGLDLKIFKVEPGASIISKSLVDSQLRRLSGCTVVAVRRGNETDISIRPDTVLEEGDLAVLLGPAGRITEASYLFQSEPHGEA